MNRNKAIEIVKKNYPHVGTSGSEFETALRELVPELKESEDERIRKAISYAICTAAHQDGTLINDVTKEEALAYLERQKELIPYTDFVIKPHKGDDNNPYDMRVSDAQEYAIKRGFGIPFNDGEVYVDERHMIQTIGNIIRWADEHPKEQKPADDKAFEEWIDDWWKHNKVNNPDSYYDKGDEIKFDERGFKNFCRGIRNMYQQQPAEWIEDYRGEDLRTRFAFYTYKDEDDALYLSNVFVEETSRNKGFGTKILAAAEKVAETIGAINIRLKVKQNSPANAWYRKHGYGYMAFEGDYDWLEKTLEYLKPINPEWSEEDEKMQTDVIGSLSGFEYLILYNSFSTSDEHIQKEISWLKSLPERFNLQPKQEWSEEDEEMVRFYEASYNNQIGDMSMKDVIDMKIKFKDWLVNRVKSLRPQSYWKPSEEQMEALAWYSGNSGVPPTGDKAIKSLYNDLKKL